MKTLQLFWWKKSILAFGFPFFMSLTTMKIFFVLFQNTAPPTTTKLHENRPNPPNGPMDSGDNAFSMTSFLTTLEPIRKDVTQVRALLTEMKTKCPYHETLPALTDRQQEVAKHPYLRTVGKVKPHAHQHLPRATDDVLDAVFGVLDTLSTLKGNEGAPTKDDVRLAFAESGMAPPAPEDIRIVPTATFVRPGDHSLGVVMRDILPTPYVSAMHHRVPVKNIRLQLRHGGTQLFPFDMGPTDSSSLETTRDVVVTAWMSADGSESLQAGTFYPGSHLPGNEPTDATGLFFKFFPLTEAGDKSLLEAVHLLLSTPLDDHKALMM